MSRLPRSLPFAELRRGVVKERIHAMYSVKAMLRVSEKLVPSLSGEDLVDVFNDVQPDALLLNAFKSNISNAIAAAALVFMHSAYENAAFDLLNGLVRYDPEPWKKYIEKRQVSIEQLSTSETNDLIDATFIKWLEEVEKKPFPWKVDILFAVLQPKTTNDVIPGFEFNAEEFRAIDTLRHELTHHPHFAKPIADVYSKLSYMNSTILLLEKLAEQKYPGTGANGGS